MSKILVANVKVPFTYGGQDALVGTLVKELKNRLHEVDTVDLPFSPEPKECLLTQAALWRSLELEKVGGSNVDLLIATKFPSYYAKHPRKSLWLVHQYRAAYDLYGGRYSDLSDDPRDEQLRELIVRGDNEILSEFAYRAAISRNVADRLKRFNNLSAEVLYPPLPQGSAYQKGVYKDYILSVARICSIKRIDLAIKAMPIVHQHIKLKIVGAPDEPNIMDYLKNEIAKHHLQNRVEFLGRVGNKELIDLYANALAVYYAPFDEDYGYATLEAMASAKPLVTALDSGGVLEFVKNQENGLVAQPTTDSIGRAINRLVEDRDLAKRLGESGFNFIQTSQILEKGWDHIIERLLSPLGNYAN
ncbi:MAG TPA: glycosyltransferase family 4 protein [Oligoflexia bacterium]|nr:glycosyltransferase family 4 protein [Oligoflexia bacterium]HMP26467.1 glycosyltransferase family 4 protein [Oligoflexia bacterium]